MEKFEDLLNELNEIVKSLESGKLTLDESIKQYQRGIDLSNKCKQNLTVAKEIVVTKMNEESNK